MAKSKMQLLNRFTHFITFSCLKTWSIAGPRSRHFSAKCLERSLLHALLWTIFTCRTSLKVGRTTKKARLSGTFHAVDKISGISHQFLVFFGCAPSKLTCQQVRIKRRTIRTLFPDIFSVYTILHPQPVSVLLIELGDYQPCPILHSTQRMDCLKTTLQSSILDRIP